MSLQDLERRLAKVSAEQADQRDQEFGIMVCKEALVAARLGNYGVGAILVNPQGDIIEYGHNQAFYPKFRSHLHAEMVVMNSFEKRFPEVDNMRGYTLICSVEPCPMCLARLLITGVQTVKFLVHDELGGMVAHLHHLPKAWNRLAERQEFVLAEVSQELRQLALDIFLVNLDNLRRKLWSR
jgi:cytosine deaminase